MESADDLAVVGTVGLRLCTRDEARSVFRFDRLAFIRKRGQLDVLYVVPAWAFDGDDEPLNEAMIARERLRRNTRSRDHRPASWITRVK